MRTAAPGSKPPAARASSASFGRMMRPISRAWRLLAETSRPPASHTSLKSLGSTECDLPEHGGDCRRKRLEVTEDGSAGLVRAACDEDLKVSAVQAHGRIGVQHGALLKLREAGELRTAPHVT